MKADDMAKAMRTAFSPALWEEIGRHIAEAQQDLIRRGLPFDILSTARHSLETLC
jgi:hypothetical protein